MAVARAAGGKTVVKVIAHEFCTSAAGAVAVEAMSEAPKIFDRALHARRLDRAAAGFDLAGFLKARAAGDLVERLAAINRTFAVAVDLGARDGAFARALAGTAPDKVGWLIETDGSRAMLGARSGPRLVLDEERLPFASETLDLVASSVALHWVNDLVGALIQIRRALKPDGLFLGALLGGATLTELRQSLTEAETRARGGAGPRVSPFIDAHDGAALLQRAGFALPVVDTDKVTVRYDHPLKLLADLRVMGETAALFDRPRAPLSRAHRRRYGRDLRRTLRAPDGKIVATFEIITLTGWAPHPEQQKPLARGSAKMRLGDALTGASTGTALSNAERSNISGFQFFFYSMERSRRTSHRGRRFGYREVWLNPSCEIARLRSHEVNGCELWFRTPARVLGGVAWPFRR